MNGDGVLSVQITPKDTSLALGLFFLSNGLSRVGLNILKVEPRLVHRTTECKREIRPILRFQLKILLHYVLEKIAVDQNLRHRNPPMPLVIRVGSRRDR